MRSGAAAKMAANSALRLSVAKISSPDEFEHLSREWVLLAEACAPDNFFQSWDFVTCWWKAYEKERELFILVCRDQQDHVTAIAPLYRATSKNRIGLRSRSLRLIGDGSDDVDGFGFLISPGFESKCVPAILDWLEANRSEWDRLDLNCMSEETAAVHELLVQIQRKAWIERPAWTPHMTVQLPATWQEYLDTLSAKVRQTWLKKIRHAEQGHDLRLRKTESMSELECDLAAVFELHNKSWRARQGRGKLEAEERREFYRLLCRAALEKRQLDLWLLEVDGIARAARLGFRAGSTRHAVLAGIGPDFAHLSLGTVIEAMVLKKCIERGDRVYDFLAGDEAYKLECRPTRGRYANLAIARPRTQAGVVLSAETMVGAGKKWIRSELPGAYQVLRKATRTADVPLKKALPKSFAIRAAELTIQVFQGCDEMESLKADWKALSAKNADVSVFLSWEWMTSWIAAYGKRELLTLAAFDKNNECVGIAPLYVAKWPNANHRSLRVLRLIGDETHDSGQLGFVTRKGSEIEFNEAIFEWLDSHRSLWDALELQGLPDNEATSALLATMELRAWLTRQRNTSHMVIELPDSMEQYRATLPRGFVKSLATSRNRLVKHAVQFQHCKSTEDVDVAMEELFRLHTRRWERRGNPGAFVDARRRQFYKLLAATLPRSLDLWTMRIDGKTVAAEFGLIDGSSRRSLQSGFDPDHARLHVGSLLDEKIIEESIRRGLKSYDLLEGEQDYKKRLGARPRKLSFVRCAPPNTMGAAWVRLSGSSTAQKLWQRLKRTSATR
jgi:CelD/BcsL family acetyltransferase involved in cellulose biosynthesis